MLSYSRPIERCRPLLGTFVRIRVQGLAPERAHAAIDAAFEEISTIHRLMSFHEPDSDVSRLNREAYSKAVVIDARTHEVLARASNVSFHSDGVFDVTVGAALVTRNVLPTQPGAPGPDKMASWRDIDLKSGNRVQFLKPLWIDLGGIAKGHAVDRAIAILANWSPTQASVNAGGDLRIFGPDSEQIRLAPTHCESEMAAMVELENGSLASSCGQMAGRYLRQRNTPHVDMYHGRALHAPQFVSVVAPSCVNADALTKVVMAKGACAAPVLAKYGARALVHDAQSGWRQIPGAA